MASNFTFGEWVVKAGWRKYHEREFGDQWQAHQDLSDYGAFVARTPLGYIDVNGGMERIKVRGKDHVSGIERGEVQRRRLLDRIAADGSTHYSTKHGYVPKQVPQTMRKEGWSQALYENHLRRVADDIGLNAGLIGMNDGHQRLGQPEVKRGPFDPGTFNTHALSHRSFQHGTHFPLMSPDQTRKVKVDVAFSNVDANAKGWSASASSGGGFLDGARTLYDSYNAYKGQFDQTTDEVKLHSKLAEAASNNAAALLSVIARLNDKDSVADFGDGSADLAMFISKHLPDHIDTFVANDRMRTDLKKGDLESLREMMTNLASSKKSINERVMIGLNELSGFLVNLMNTLKEFISAWKDLMRKLAQQMA